MRIFSAALMVFLITTPPMFGDGVDAKKVAEYFKTLPTVTPPGYDAAKRETLAAYAISCTDHPEESPANRNNYLWQYAKPPQLLDAYDKNSTFYGCSDWHSAVGSTWALMSLLKQDPKISVASEIKDIAAPNFRKPNIDGERAFFNSQRWPETYF